MHRLPIEQAFDVAFGHHQAGRLKVAERLYRQILAGQPEHAEALHHLGLIAHQTGQNEVAIALIGRAIRLNPARGQAHHNLGSALQAQGRRAAAIAAYRQAIALNPDLAESYNNLANTLRDDGQLDEAIDSLRTAVGLRPQYATAHFNLGIALKEASRLDEAIAEYRQAIALQPDNAQSHLHLANGLREQGQLSSAIAAYRQAIALRSDCLEAHYNLGIVLNATGRLDEAEASYRRAIACNPSFAAAYNNLAVVLTDQGQLDEAIATLQRAIALKPDFAEAHGNLGNALKSNGQLDQAVAAYQVAIQLSPDPAAAYNNLGVAFQELGQLDEALSAYRRAYELQPEFAHVGSNIVFSMLHDVAHDAATAAEEHHRWGQRHAEPLRRLIQPFLNSRNAHRRLRIGYVSADFRQHPVGRFMLPLLEHHNPRDFETFCYFNRSNSDALTVRLRAAAHHWREIAPLDNRQAADLIRADQIDVLVDLSGHTLGNRLLLFAQKPAPVQVSFLGYPGTTGLRAIDYRLTDRYADPPGLTDRFYSERLYRLPETSWCFAAAADSPTAAPPPLIRKGCITFGSFNNFLKVNDTMLQLWGRILRQVPRSRLLLKAAALGSTTARQRVQRSLIAQGIKEDRLDLRGLQPDHATHLAAYRDMDIALDTFPYHGTTTTCEALWMGVPVITLAGQTHISRVGVSLLNNIGLQELIASDADDYVSRAAALAGDHDRLTTLRLGLRERMRTSPLMDARSFAENVEAAYRVMWRAWCDRPSVEDETASAAAVT